MKTVCHITSVHPRHDIRIFEKECVSLSKEGYDVYLVVNDEGPNEEYKGVHIVSTGVKRKGRLERIIKAPKWVLKKAVEINADVYHLHDPELLSISDQLLRMNKKVIFDAHEDTEKQIQTKYWIPKLIRPIIGGLYSFYASGKFKRMSAIISVTPSIVDKLKKYNTNVVMVTNYPIIEELQVTNTQVDANKYVFFAGGIMEQWSHENVMDAVEQVEDVDYIYAGRGRDAYLEILCNKGNGKSQYLGLLSHDDVMRYYHNSVAGLALLKSTTQVGKDGTLGNTKLFEVMEAGRPVICSDLKLWKEIVDKYKCGICVNPDDVSAIANAIKYLSQNAIEGNAMGERGRKAVENEYNWSTQEKTLFMLYDKICEE